MGNQRLRKILRLFPLCLIIFFSLASCGDFTIRDDEVETGDVDEMHIFLSQDKLRRLYSSVATDSYTTCTLDKGKWHGDANIKVRGFSSRLKQKKSFTLKIDGKKYMLERGQENGGIYNRIAMRAYQLAGVSACDTESVALFLNEEYLGCYNLISYYDPSTIDGELYKIWFKIMTDLNLNHPISSLSEKKFPKDNDLSNLERLEAACASLTSEDWFNFVNTYVDVEKCAAYLVVHDFLTVINTHRTNLYIQYDGKYRLIPWDNEQCLLKERADYNSLDDNQLIQRLAQVPEFKAAYNRIMGELFTNGGDTCILDTLSAEAAVMFDNLATAMESDPEYSTSRQDFMKIKAYVLAYLDKNTGRASDGDSLILH